MRSDCDWPGWGTVSTLGTLGRDHGVERTVTLQHPHTLLRGAHLAALLRFTRRAAEVRRHEHVVKREERMILARRLAFHDVDRRAGDTLLAQAFEQRAFIDHAAARQVDEARRLFHQR